MAVEFKDYYKTLGVARTASDDEIRKSFRKLAREYHPDVAKKAGAEEKFKEINEAYEVLGDPEKRKKYDALGASWRQGGFTSPPGGQYRSWRGPGSPNGAEGYSFEFGGTGFSDFYEQFFGSMGRGGYEPQSGGRRGGFSTQNFAEPGRDVEADIMVTLEEVVSGSVRQISLRRNIPCPKCGGTGYVSQKVCPQCHGAAQETATETHQVRIPAGVGEGQKLRLAGKGEAGVGGAAAGDLFLRVRLAAHPDFRVEDGNLLHDLDLAPWEAALGTKVSVPTLEGPVSIKIPPGTQAGQKLRVRERGLPNRSGPRGDLVVFLRVQVPKQIDEREKALWEQLARESKFNPRD